LYGILSLLAERASTFGKASAALAIPHLTEKLGDLKLKKPAGDTLTVFAEKTSLSFVFGQCKFIEERPLTVSNVFNSV